MLFPLPVGLFPRFFEKKRIERVFYPLFVARNRRLPDLERLDLGPVQPIHLLNWIVERAHWLLAEPLLHPAGPLGLAAWLAELAPLPAGHRLEPIGCSVALGPVAKPALLSVGQKPLFDPIPMPPVWLALLFDSLLRLFFQLGLLFPEPVEPLALFPGRPLWFALPAPLPFQV